MLKKLKILFWNTVTIIKDLLFDLPFGTYNVSNGVMIMYRSYLPKSVNFRIIKRMLIRQGYLEEKAEQIAHQFISHINLAESSFFVPVTIAIFPSLSADKLTEILANAKVTVIDGDTFEEKVKKFDENVRRIRSGQK